MDDGVAVAIKYAVVRDDPGEDAYLDGLLRRVDGPRHQRHGRAARHRPPARLGSTASPPAPGASRRVVQRAALRGRSREVGRGGDAARALHAARRPARRLGPGARAPPRHGAGRHRADRTDPAVRVGARSAGSIDSRPWPRRLPGSRHEPTAQQPRICAATAGSARTISAPSATAPAPTGRFQPRDIAGKPVIAILNTWSDANPCHTHFRVRAEESSAASGRPAVSRWRSRS